MAASAFSGEVEIDGIMYDISTKEQTAKVIGPSNPNISGDLVIPSSVIYEDRTCYVNSVGGFENCAGINSVSISEGVTEIKSRAFEGCEKLSVIIIPNSINKIGAHSFDGTAWYDAQDNGIVYLDEILYAYKGDMPQNADITIKEGTTIISSAAFSSMINLRSIKLPKTLRSIGRSAFFGCSGLSEITIPDNVYVNSQAFSNCTGLKTVTICNATLYEGESPIRVFEKCNNIENVILHCSEVGNWFYDMHSIVNVTLGEGVESVRYRAFENCIGIDTITISNSVKQIMGFSGCTGIRYITIPDNVEVIGERCFYNCSGLLNLVFSSTSNIRKIDKEAFYACNNLKNVQLPNRLDSIGKWAFSDCENLASLVLPKEMKEIKDYAFQNCKSLKEIVVPYGITNIDEGICNYCSNLRTITLPVTVQAFSNRGNSFAYCKELIDVYCYAPNAPTIIQDPFYGSLIQHVTLHVPESSIEAYKAANIWKDFKSIVGLTDTNNYFEMTVNVGKNGTVVYGEQSVTDGEQTLNVKEGTEAVLTLTPDEGYRLASVTVDGVDKTADVAEGKLTISDVKAGMTVDVRFIKDGEVATVTIGATGVATFCSTKNLDFSEVDALSAYTGAGFNRETGVLTMLKVTDAPAGTGLIVKGSEGTYEVPVKTSASVYANLLVGVTEETTLSQTASGYVNYILANGSHGLGFYIVEDEGTLAAGKAYLRLPAAVAGESRAIAIEFAEDATGIEGISGDGKAATDEWFDLQGRRIAKPTKAGIYLNNGHKIIVK